MSDANVPEWAEKLLAKQQEVIDTLVKAQNELVQEQKGLVSTVAMLVTAMTAMTSKIGDLVQLVETNSAKNAGSPPPPTPEIMKAVAYAAVVQAKLDSSTIEEKSKNLVVLNLGELDSSGNPVKGDEMLVAEMIHSVGDPTLVKKLKEGKIKFRRHPTDRPPTARGRPLKLFFESQGERDLVLQHVKRNKTALMKEHPHSFIRRDYTAQELAVDRDLRQRAGLLNAAEGHLRYLVRDFEICQLPKPRPLPPRKA